MEDYLLQIETALQNNLYFVALSCTLTLPDICGALSSTDNKASGSKYKEWYDKYAFGKCSNVLDGHNCYKFRCSLLHQGSSQDSSNFNKSNFSRILFLEPQTNNIVIMHDNQIECDGVLVLNIDVNIFCRGMIAAVREWREKINSSEIFQRNFDNLIKRYDSGLIPFISGIPVIS